MLTRAYSTFEVKTFDDAQRIVEGIASTPNADRMGDIVESKGAQFKLPLPLLWQHQSREPIGHVLSATVTDKGISIRAQIAKGLLPRIDEAWALIKSGLVRGLSIGFRGLDMEPLDKKDPWGPVRFKTWEWLELSAVTIPANMDASIQTIRSLGSASGLPATDVRASSQPPAAVGRHRQEGRMATPISDQVVAAQADLKTKTARFEQLMTKDGADGGLEPAEATELTELGDSVATLSARVKNLKALEIAQMEIAEPVRAKRVETNTNQIQPFHQVEVKSNLQPGIEFARYVICRMAAMKHNTSALELAKTYYPDNPRIQWQIKDNIPAGSATDNLFAKPLVNATISQEFLEWLRPTTVLGRIPGLRQVPFNVRITGQSSGATGYWVGEGQSKPLTRYGFTSTTLTWAKVAAIIAITDELARFSSPSAEMLVRDEIAAALRERLDIDFLDPTKAAVANVSPASITNGVTNLNDTGATLANTQTDMAQFMNAMINNNFDVAQCVWIMPTSVALQLQLMLTSTGLAAFPNITMTGGTLLGLPVVTSQYLLFSHTPANNKVVLVHAPSIALSDDGGFTIDVSREASLEMDDQPVMASTSTAGSPSGPTGSALVSMFQTNSIAIRCERYINWARLRTGAVVWMDDVRWAA